MLELFTEKVLSSELTPIKEFLIEEELPPELHRFYLIIRCRSILAMVTNNPKVSENIEAVEVINRAKDVYAQWLDTFKEKTKFSAKILKTSELDLIYGIYQKYLIIGAGKNPDLSWDFLFLEADYCNDGTLGTEEDLNKFLKLE